MDEKLQSDLCRQLAGYFGGGKEAEGLALLRKDVAEFSETARIFRSGLDSLLEGSGSECLSFVQQCANRNVNDSEKEARAWLSRLRRELFER